MKQGIGRSGLLLSPAAIAKMCDVFLPVDCIAMVLHVWPFVPYPLQSTFIHWFIFSRHSGQYDFLCQNDRWALMSRAFPPVFRPCDPTPASLPFLTALHTSSTPLKTSQRSLCTPPTLHRRPFIWNIDLVSFLISCSSAIQQALLTHNKPVALETPILCH